MLKTQKNCRNKKIKFQIGVLIDIKADPCLPLESTISVQEQKINIIELGVSTTHTYLFVVFTNGINRKKKLRFIFCTKIFK